MSPTGSYLAAVGYSESVLPVAIYAMLDSMSMTTVSFLHSAISLNFFGMSCSFCDRLEALYGHNYRVGWQELCQSAHMGRSRHH
jgi:hypothetical protein